MDESEIPDIGNLLERIEPILGEYAKQLQRSAEPGQMSVSNAYIYAGLFWKVTRENENASREKIAASLGIDEMILTAFEEGIMTPEIARALPSKIAKALGKPVMYEVLYPAFMKAHGVTENMIEELGLQ